VPAYGELVQHSGNRDLQRALELSLLACLRQQTLHVHVEGLRGTGKTTVIRAAAGLLPPIRRIAGCPYNCDPDRPHCPLHRALDAEGRSRLGEEWVPAPFLEVSASARLGTVVGSIDLGRLTARDGAEAALLPGTLARAHRGIVFVDEVNRLADTAPELADALLDVMGTKPGRLQIEEPGLAPVVLACNVSIWAASNPDEEPGPLADVRRQLADRFDLAVAMRRPAEPAAVFAVLARGGEGAVSPGAPGLPPPGATGDAPAAPVPWPRREGAPGGCPRTAALRAELADQARAPAPSMPPALRMRLARAYCDFQLESLRAVLAWQTAATLSALRAGRAAVTLADLSDVAPAVLRHRLDADDLAQVLSSLQELPDEADAQGADGAGSSLPAAAAASQTAAGSGAGAALASGAAEVEVPEVPSAVQHPSPPGTHGPAAPGRGGGQGRVRPPAFWAQFLGRGGRGGRTPPQAAQGAPPEGGGATPGTGAWRFADPTRLPPLAPRTPARPLGALPPGAAWRPVPPAPGDGAAPGARGDPA
jgi:magnesium chelatase subunit I